MIMVAAYNLFNTKLQAFAYILAEKEIWLDKYYT